MTSSTGLSSSDPFIQSRLVQLLQEATVFVQICFTNSEQLSRILEEKFERNSSSLSLEAAARCTMELTAEREEFLLQLSDYNEANKILERKLLE